MDMSHLVSCACARNAQIHDHALSLYRLGTLPEYEQYSSLCPYEMHKLFYTSAGFAHQFCQYLPSTQIYVLSNHLHMYLNNLSCPQTTPPSNVKNGSGENITLFSVFRK